MEVFVATKESQGTRPSDFSFVEDGELVKFSFKHDKCADSNVSIDKGCGCMRSVISLETVKGTTTFTVADLEMTEGEYTERVRQCYRTSRWYGAMKQDEAEQAIASEVKDLLRLARHFGVGKVLEIRNKVIQVREKV